jgi:hypothetical protein
MGPLFPRAVKLISSLFCVTVGSLPVLGPAPFKCSITPRSSDPDTARKIRAFAAELDPSLTVEDGSVYDAPIKKVLAKREQKS